MQSSPNFYYDGCCDLPCGFTGPAGTTGAKGDRGLRGHTGQQGPQGSPGPVGPQGSRGPTGFTGMKGSTGQRGPVGPTGFFSINGNTGSATGTQINIIGCNGISTSGTGNNLTICNNVACTQYVVGPTGTSKTLQQAVDKINAADDSNPATVIMQAGTYDLPDLRFSRKITFVGCSTASVNIRGDATSYGNKCWSNVTFAGTGTYTIENTNLTDNAEETFNECKFLANMTICTNNEILKFNNCLFDYRPLLVEDVIKVNNGCGALQFKYCCFNINRHGGSNIKSAINFGGNTNLTDSLVFACVIRLNVDGSNDFVMFKINSLQGIRASHNNITIGDGPPDRFFLFGNITAVVNTKLELTHNYITSSSSSHYLIGNLISSENILFINHNYFIGGAGFYYLNEMLDNVTNNISISFNTSITRQSRSPVYIRPGSLSTHNIWSDNDTYIHDYNSSVYQLVGTSSATVFLILTNVNFISFVAGMPAWLTTSLSGPGTVNIEYANVNRKGFNSFNNTGSATINSTVLNSGI